MARRTERGLLGLPLARRESSRFAVTRLEFHYFRESAPRSFILSLISVEVRPTEIDFSGFGGRIDGPLVAAISAFPERMMHRC